MGAEEKRGKTFRNSADEIFKTIKNWIKKRINVLGKKTGAQNIVKEIKQYQKKWLQHVQRMDTNRIPNKYYDIHQKDEGT